MSRTRNRRPEPKKPKPQPKAPQPPNLPTASDTPARFSGWWKWAIGGVALAVIVAVSIGVGGITPAERPAGAQQVPIASPRHVEGNVDYDYHPAGGEHAGIWLNCGVYREEVPAENVVHSMEHGAVWVTYRPDDVTDDDIARLEGLVDGKVIVSPRADQPAPIMAATWGNLIEPNGADDPELEEFVNFFRGAGDAPEAAGRCNGGVGNPL